MIQHKRRDKLQTFLEEQQIQTAVNYPIPLHLQESAQHLGYKKGDFPVAEEQAQNILSIPLYPELEDSQVEYVIAKIKRFIQNT